MLKRYCSRISKSQQIFFHKIQIVSLQKQAVLTRFKPTCMEVWEINTLQNRVVTKLFFCVTVELICFPLSHLLNMVTLSNMKFSNADVFDCLSECVSPGCVNSTFGFLCITGY